MDLLALISGSVSPRREAKATASDGAETYHDATSEFSESLEQFAGLPGHLEELGKGETTVAGTEFENEKVGNVAQSVASIPVIDVPVMASAHLSVTEVESYEAFVSRNTVADTHQTTKTVEFGAETGKPIRSSTGTHSPSHVHETLTDARSENGGVETNVQTSLQPDRKDEGQSTLPNAKDPLSTSNDADPISFSMGKTDPGAKTDSKVGERTAGFSTPHADVNAHNAQNTASPTPSPKNASYLGNSETQPSLPGGSLKPSEAKIDHSIQKLSDTPDAMVSGNHDTSEANMSKAPSITTGAFASVLNDQLSQSITTRGDLFVSKAIVTNPVPPDAIPQAVVALVLTSKKATIQIDPPELGRINIDYAFEGSQKTVVTLIPETEAARTLLLDKLPLMTALLEDGSLGDIEVQVGDSSDFGMADENPDTSKRSGPGQQSSDDDDLVGSILFNSSEKTKNAAWKGGSLHIRV